MITKYEANAYQGTISVVEATKETPKAVWVRGIRMPKQKYGYTYHDTWEEAKSYMESYTEKRIDEIQAEAERYQEWVTTTKVLLSRIRSLQKP